jgi:mannose-6-phosphate isomerase-like protein (cupin superfamily)
MARQNDDQSRLDQIGPLCFFVPADRWAQSLRLRCPGVGGLATYARDPEGNIIELRSWRQAHDAIVFCVPQPEPRNIATVLADLTDHWSPRTIAVVNDYDVRVVKVHGQFTRHSHPETDEFFFVLSGQLTIRMEEGNITLRQGDTFVVPRGRVHQPYSDVETTLLLFEPSETVNTGDTPGSLTAERTVI